MDNTAPAAVAGSLESNDIHIIISARQDNSDENDVVVESIVMKQFGPQIIAAVNSALAQFSLRGVCVYAKDRGALDCTIRARMEAAIMRYMEARS